MVDGGIKIEAARITPTGFWHKPLGVYLCHLTKYGTYKEEKVLEENLSHVKFEVFEEASKKTRQVGHRKGQQFKRVLWSRGELGQASVCHAYLPAASVGMAETVLEHIEQVWSYYKPEHLSSVPF